MDLQQIASVIFSVLGSLIFVCLAVLLGTVDYFLYFHPSNPPHTPNIELILLVVLFVMEDCCAFNYTHKPIDTQICCLLHTNSEVMCVLL